MFVVTNRKLFEQRTGLDVFGTTPNPAGPNEIRLVSVAKSGGKHTVEVLDDKLSVSEVRALIDKYSLDIDEDQDWFASLKVACELFEAAQTARKHILIFVHGYNNDIADVIRTAERLESLYEVIVVPFSWPANGGGKLSGTAAYLSDKDDARASSTALHRTVEKIHFYHGALTSTLQTRLWDKAAAKHPDSLESARRLFTELINKECHTTLNMLCHSMGNYVLKHALTPSGSSLRQLVFDNVVLAAADANNPGHEEWVEAMDVRNRLYITINEDDGALAWSRRKPGDEQEERLGHHLRNLGAHNAYYIDVTKNKGVGDDHSYFKSGAVDSNKTLWRMFKRMFEGARAEESMRYHPELNLYRS